jgi:hypothetical protein
MANINTLPYCKAWIIVGIAIGTFILSVVLCLPFGAWNILLLLVGSKAMAALIHEGYDFVGGHNVLGYLISGMVITVLAVALCVSFAGIGGRAASIYSTRNAYVTPVV